jgi:hypothetical protein
MVGMVSNWMHRVSKGWVTLASLIIFLLFTALVLPDQAANAEAAAGEVGSPDMSFYYSANKLYEFAGSYGEEGREAYIRARFTFDLIWPLVYGLFLSTGISWLFRRAFSHENRWQLANIAPLLGVLFDYLENISTSLVMARYPSPTAVADWLAGVFTMVKWLLIGGSFALLLAGIVIGAWRWASERSRQ